jgi:hypothetical protein
MPVRSETVRKPVNPGDGELWYEALLTFRDASGVNWKRKRPAGAQSENRVERRGGCAGGVG